MTRADAGGEGDLVNPLLLLGFAAVGYGALAICVTGVAALITDTDVIAVPGLGPAPGALAVLVSVLVFAATLWPVVRLRRPAYTGVVPVALAAALSHLAALWLLALVFGTDLGAATAAVAGAVTGWTSFAFLAAAAVAAWSATAFRRTASRPPKWPWEREQEDE
ncbi:hypothetical protein [Microbacterium sp. Marseille-Q6965]|uniref:hypothetical protein n=1 Tax=Microbacterium sp. Marseille-Q6965 TaxID=2965072 RepID=UPI0021B7520B|nr:hypothetical protein [Microbacterium sp. Marseille-Q6965]